MGEVVVTESTSARGRPIVNRAKLPESYLDRGPGTLRYPIPTGPVRWLSGRDPVTLTAARGVVEGYRHRAHREPTGRTPHGRCEFLLGQYPWTRVCPWLTISRAFWIAVDPRKLLLASVALLLLAGGTGWSTNCCCRSMNSRRKSFRGKRWRAGRSRMALGPVFELRPVDDGDPLGEAGLWLTDPRGVTLRVASNWRVVLLPLDFLRVPAEVLGTFPATPTEWIRAAALFAWGVVVWSVFGGAIGRMAAASFSRRQTLSVRAALWFSITKLPGYLTAPLLPITGIGLMLAVVALGSLLGRIPEAGPTIVAVGYGLGAGAGIRDDGAVGRFGRRLAADVRDNQRRRK